MMAAMRAIDEQRDFGRFGPMVFRGGLIVAAVGLIAGALLTALVDGIGWDHFFRSYLMAFIFILTICLGGLFFVMLQHATRAGWSVVVRRVPEAIAANLRWIWILFIPIALGTVFGWHHLYHWLHPAGDAILEHKAPYFFFFNPAAHGEADAHDFVVPWFWLLRAALFFVIWGVLGHFFWRTSVLQDSTGDVALTHRMQWWAPLGLLLYALTQTFAAVDWVMSLEAHWFSTMFGVYFFAGSTCAIFATMAITYALMQRGGLLTADVTKEHFQDIGKLLFAFGVVFWTYIGFSQYMLIWYANIPEETGWFMARQMGGWKTMSLLLLLGHFALPFVLLVTKHTKRIPLVLAGIAGWMLLMHVVDVYWLVMPTIPADFIAGASTYAEVAAAVEAGEVSVGWNPTIVDLAMLVGMAGLLVAMTARTLAAAALAPIGDPRMNEALAFENM